VFPSGLLIGLICSVFFSLTLPNLVFKEGFQFLHLEIFLSFVSLCFLFRSLNLASGISIKVQLLTGFAAGYSLMLLYWIYIPLGPFKGISPPFALLLTFVFFLLHFIPYLVVMPIFLSSRLKTSSFKYILLFSFSLALAETLYPQILPLVPAHALLNLSVARELAQLGGIPLVSFVFYLFILTCASKNLSFRKKTGVLLLSVILIHLPSRFITEDSLVGESELRFNLVQPNVANKIKQDVELLGMEKFASSLQQELFHATTKENTDLIIWPETAIPFNLTKENLSSSPVQVPILKKGVLSSSYLLTGVFMEVETSPDRATNSVVLLENGELISRYDKRMLKPFAETFPIESLNGFVGNFFTTPYNIVQGTSYQMFKIKGFGFIPFVCYESLKSEYWRDYLNSLDERPYFIVSLANDKWFGSSSQPYLHYFINQWRSIEYNLPVVRSANSGVSGIILPESLNFFRTPSGVRASPVVNLSMFKRRKTLYQQYGLLPLIYSFLFLILIDWIVNRVSGRNKSSNI
jgi:apolipoprotein N-acyltransferase